MTVSKTNYLQTCFEAFGEVIEKKYSRPFDLRAIENSVKHLRREVPLSYADLQQFESPKYWWFEKFWVFPPEHQVSSSLKKRKFNFWILPKHEDEVVRSLYEAFKSIELVSIVLRFIKPENYGIISPPVERVLDVRRGSDAVETYLNYLKDLRAVAKHYQFARVADADVALWVVHEKCYGESKDHKVEKEYHADGFLLSLRAENLMGHFFGQYSHADLAKALAPVNGQLAGQIGGIAFERMVRKRLRGETKNNVADKDLKAVIDDLRDRGVIDALTAGQWHRARRVRNKAIHGESPPTSGEVTSMLKLLD